ncbi:hypothetical protein ACWGOK_41400 [Streptomyces eurythermus]
MTPMQRLLEEAIPLRPDHAKPANEPWTQVEQDTHWAALCAAVGTPNARRPTPAVNQAQTAA